MSRPLRFALALMAATVFLCPCGLANEQGKEDPMRVFAKLERGMTPEQVREQVGAPKRVARQILYHRYLEQWVYDHPVSARIQFDCPRGQKPQLLWKQTLPAVHGGG